MSERVVMVVALVIGIVGVAQGKYGGGTGELNDPYQIWDANQFDSIRCNLDDWDKHFVLMDDIDVSGYNGCGIYNIIGYRVPLESKPFRGVFDGGGHTVSGFVYTDSGGPIGLFGYTEGAKIRNLGLLDPVVDAAQIDVGALVGQMSGGEISNCYVVGGTVRGASFVGGLVGINGDVGMGENGGIIVNCYSEGSISGSGTDVGGLVGHNDGTIADCSSAGTVEAGSAVGGFVGVNDNGTIAECCSQANVLGSLYAVGGLVGRNEATITECYSTGIVEADQTVGGLVGFNSTDGRIVKSYSHANVSGNRSVGGLIGRDSVTGGSEFPGVMQCYSTGDVNGVHTVGGLLGYTGFETTVLDCYSTSRVNGDTVVGGFIGGVSLATITNCYYAGSIACNGEAGGFVGNNYGSTLTQCYWDVDISGEIDMCSSQEEGATGCDNSSGKTTAEMMQQSTFTNWDFINVWGIGEGQTYPYLRKYPAADLNKDKSVNLLDLTIFAEQWMFGTSPAPTMTYDVGGCDVEWPPPPADGLRFTATVDGRYAEFDDPIFANCCIAGVELEMTLEGNAITIIESEIPEALCYCMCHWPATARLGPFEPGAYTLDVYQIDYDNNTMHIGQAEVVIGP